METTKLNQNLRTERIRVVAQVGALISAILASTCCWLPLLLITVGVSGGTLAGKFEVMRPVLLPVTCALLGLAFYFTYRKPKKVASSGTGTGASGNVCRSVPELGTVEACCPPGNARGLTLKKVNKVMLWVVTVFVLAFAFFPNYVGYLLGGGTLAARNDLGKVVVEVEGMTCEACAVAIEDSLRNVAGVVAAEVDYGKRHAIVGVPQGSEPPLDAILSAVADAGNYQGRFADQAQWTLAIEGMTCEGCATGLQAALAKVSGVSGATVSYEDRQARISATSSVSEEALRKVVSGAGYTLKSAERR